MVLFTVGNIRIIGITDFLQIQQQQSNSKLINGVKASGIAKPIALPINSNLGSLEIDKMKVLTYHVSKCIKLSLTKNKMHNLSKGVHNNKNKLENIDKRVTKLLERAKLSNPRRMLKKLLQDIDR
jgi:hypothetical protein